MAIFGLKIGSRFYQNSYRLTDLQNRQFADFSAELVTLEQVMRNLQNLSELLTASNWRYLGISSVLSPKSFEKRQTCKLDV